jgi:hypothetical protein
MKGFEDERVLEYQRNPAPVLPQPIHTANNSVLGGISMGYTRQRRYILTSFVDEIANLQDQLSLWARRHVRHLNEFTTNRVSSMGPLTRSFVISIIIVAQLSLRPTNTMTYQHHH